MRKLRKSVIPGLIVIIGMSALILKAQPDPTAEQATLDAIVQSYFDQTASAAPLIGQTQTLQAAFDNAQTATASFDATVQAAFNTAATATQLAIATPTPLPAPNRVISTQQLDFVAGMAGRNIFLAPNGERFAHVSTIEVCIYTIAGVQERCISLDDVGRSPDLDRFRWSADSRYLAFTEDFIIRFSESDVWVIDADSGSLTNITDDGVTGSAISDAATLSGNLDFAPLWLDDGRLVFIRYHRTDEGSTGVLYSIQADGSELTEFATLPVERGFPVYAFDVSRDGRFLAYNWFDPLDDAGERNGLWLLDLQTGEERQLFAAPSNGEAPLVVSFSADGQYVMWHDPRFMLAPEEATPQESPVRVISVNGGEPMILDDKSWVLAAWWSPHGSAFAYLVRDLANPSISGLSVASAPGAAGQKMLDGLYLPPSGRMSVPVIWATNDTIILSNAPEQAITVVELGN